LGFWGFGVLGFWGFGVLGSIKDLELRKKVLEELKRVLKPGGTIYLVENDKGGEYKKVIDGVSGDEKTELKLEWLRNNNFCELKKIETYFEFESTETAKKVFESIWDAETAEEVNKKTLSHNIIILEYTPNIVLDSTKYVIDHANYVNINKLKLQEFIDNFSLQTESNWLKDSPFDINTLDNEQKLMVAVVFNAISFSYWGEPYWNVEYKGRLHTRGSWSLMAAIFRSIEEGESLLDPVVLASVTKEKLADILRGNTEIPLLDERKQILNNVGKIIIEKYKGKFSNVIAEAEGDAMRLLNIILTEFNPSFEDSYDYKGQKVYFNKRAQAMVESIHSIFGGKDYGSLKNIELLTALADYIIPNMLRNAGILEYYPELADKIDRKEIIPMGSEYEIEIRAGVVWTVEYIRRGLLQKGILVSSKSINDYLWTQGGSVETQFHRTRTTAY
jgi:hypothetical protein